MRELTFKSYLKNKVRETSQSNSLDIAKLVFEATSGNRDLYAPLTLYCAMCEKNSALMKAVSKHPDFDRSYILTSVTEKELGSKKSLIPEHYKNIYQGYLEEKAQNKISHEYKEKLRLEIIRLNKRYKFSVRKLSLVAGIDPSNLNAFIKNKDYSKVCPEKLDTIVDYLSNL